MFPPCQLAGRAVGGAPAPRRAPALVWFAQKTQLPGSFWRIQNKRRAGPKEPARPRLSFGSPQELAPYACRAGCRASQGLFPQPLLISCYSDVKASRSGSPCTGRPLGLRVKSYHFAAELSTGGRCTFQAVWAIFAHLAVFCVRRRGRRGPAGRAEWAKAACRSGSRAPNPPAP